MRIHELLFEYKRDITAQKMGKALLVAAHNDTHFIKSMAASTPERVVDAVLAALEGMDPSKSKKYVQWLANQYTQGKFRIEDSGRVQNVITKYIRFLPQFKRLGKNSDLNSYSFHDLERLMDELSGTDLSDGDFDTSNPDIKVLYNGPLGTLCIPLTQEASCEVGRGTKWCTAATEKSNRYHLYAKNAPLYVWRDRSGEKYQFWWGVNNSDNYQFMDASDIPIDNDLLKSFRLTHPVLSKLFAMKEKEMLPSINITSMYRYAFFTIEDRWLEAEPYIMKNPEYAYAYAKGILKGRWLEAEPYIIKNPEYAYAYARYVFKGRWKEAESFIIQNPEYAYRYARYVLKRRWSEAEPIIMQNPKFAVCYAKDILDDRWLEAEPVIKTDPSYWEKYVDHFEIEE